MKATHQAIFFGLSEIKAEIWSISTLHLCHLTRQQLKLQKYPYFAMGKQQLLTVFDGLIPLIAAAAAKGENVKLLQ